MPRAAGSTPMTQKNAHGLIAAIAQSNLQLGTSMGHLTASQSSFMRSAADVDPNIGTFKAHPFLPIELDDVKTIDNTVSNDHRSGLSAPLRDLRTKAPDDYNGVVGSDGYDATDPRHAIAATTYGAGHDPFTDDRADQL